MIYPIYAYGSPVLRKVAQPIESDYEGLNELIENMFETMYKADGMGLAAPQIGKSIRLFIIDTTALGDDDETLKDFKKIFINAKIYEEEGDEWAYNEGCLSLPGIREDVKRKPKLRMRYQDENFKEYDELFEGMQARVIQHEYDHLEGVVFTDRVGILRKRLLKSKLANITKGKTSASYKMSFPALKR